MMATTSPRDGLPKLSVREAAYVAHVSVRAVNQAIGRNELPATRRMGHRVVHRVPVSDLLMFIVVRKLARWSTVHGRARRQLQAALGDYLSQLTEPVWAARDAEWHDWMTRTITPVAFGPVTIDALELFEEPLASLRRVLRSRATVDSDPEIRGEPVVRHTRIPVHLLADLRKQGVHVDELLDDYPALTDDMLSAALLWAELHPPIRRQMSKAPWHRSRGRVLLAGSDGPMQSHTIKQRER